MTLIRLICITSLLMFSVAQPARALTLLRDPDIEHALKELAAPILKSAGLSPARTDILVIDDTSLNAFVVDRSAIFLHSGLIMKMDNAAMLQSVIAHEAAHITNGHLTRRPVAMRNARTAAGIGAVLAGAAAAATGEAGAVAAAAVGAQNSAMRMFLAHTRSEEYAADQTGLRYLAQAGIDPQGAVQVMDIFRGQEALPDARRDPFAQTHPVSSDRYRVLQRLAAGYAESARPQPRHDYWFARAKSKLSAFERSPKWTLTRAGEYGHDDIRLMREAIAYHRQSDLRRALAAIDGAIAGRSDDAYLHDLRGQILLESRRIEPAVAAYARASALDPRNALILGAYGRALLADGQVGKAAQVLEKARARDGRDMRVLRDLAAAQARLGNRGMASVLTAERYAMRGRMEDAGIHAKRASDLLPRGSAAWQRAQDVLSAADRAEKQRR